MFYFLTEYYCVLWLFNFGLQYGDVEYYSLHNISYLQSSKEYSLVQIPFSYALDSQIKPTFTVISFHYFPFEILGINNIWILKLATTYRTVVSKQGVKRLYHLGTGNWFQLKWLPYSAWPYLGQFSFFYHYFALYISSSWH